MPFPCRRAIRMSQHQQAVLVWSKEVLGTLQAHFQYNKKIIPKRNTNAIPFSIYFMVRTSSPGIKHRGRQNQSPKGAELGLGVPTLTP